MVNTTIGSYFEKIAARFPLRAAVETPDGSMTYAQINESSDIIAGQMLSIGIRHSTHIGLWAKDAPYTLLIYLAAVKIGAIPVLLNTSLSEAELNTLISKTDVEYLFFDDGYRNVSYPEICSRLTLGRDKLVYIGRGRVQGFRHVDELPLSGSEEISKAKDITKPEDTDVIIFTSGTSGAAKGVETSHYARVNSALAHIKALELNEEDKVCVALPMFHCFGLTGVILASLMCGACLYFPPERRTRHLLEAISVYKCTIFSAVPTLFSAILARNDFLSYNLSSLRTGFIGGSIYTTDFFRKVEDSFGMSLAPSLGQTEATAGLTFISPKEPLSIRESTIGSFMEGIEGKIADIKTGETLKPGVEGEICIRGYTVMKGYYKEPELTKAAIDADKWLHTGDLAYMDERGNLHITGRLKELIIRGGENIAPGEIEAVILSDPRVRETKVVGVPDSHYGEEICACVVLKQNSSMTEEEVRKLVEASLCEYKIPRYVLFMNEFPKTSSGKIALAELRKAAIKQILN